MATGAAHGGTRSEAVRANDALSYRQAIDRQLNRTRRQVKLVELGASSVLLLAGVLGFLLLASLVDHWVISLGHVGRTVLLGVLLAGVAWYAWQKVLPLLLRSINPEYAAHAIEESTPSLKNSLLNFLLLRRSPASVKEVVLEALEKRAATDIAAVPVDAAVDRSKVIRMGYLLVGMMAVLGLYKVLSPKDPFQTVARVFAPWADIARPSRVQISDVQPGSDEVYIGETVTVSAAVAGARDGDPVSVVYSTADGTVIDQRVPMTAASGGRFEATLPAGGAAGTVSSTGGLQQNTIYRVEAGDAVTSEYRLSVIAAPRIVVEKVEYAFPAYARKAPQSTERGDLKGLEGTRVMITARANQPIKTAWIEFDPDPKSGPAETMKLDVSGDQATGVLVLQLRADRRTSWRNAYQLRFINERQQQSQQPVLHGIEVLRDLPPEVEIIAPQAREIDVPENGAQTIEVRAVDPDFGLTKVDLMGRARNREVVIRSLLEPADGELPQVSRKFTFRPSEWKWKAGDVLTYWAVAEDNRTAVPSVASVRGAAMPTPDPQPNVAKTEQYVIRVVPARAPDERGGAANDPNAAGNEEQPAEVNDAAGQNDSPMNAGQRGKSNKGDNQSASEMGDTQKGENSEQGDKGNSSSQKSNQSGENSQQSSGSDSGDGDSQSQQGGGSSSSGEMGESGSQNSGDASAGGESGGSGKPDSNPGGQSGAQSGNQAGSQESGEPSESGSQGGGSQGGTQQNSRSNGDEPQQSDESGDSAGQQGSRSGRGGSGSKKPEHDGDVFDKLLEEMQQQEGDASQQSGESGQGGKQPGENNAGQNNAGQNAQGGNQRDPMNGSKSAGNDAEGSEAENQADQGNPDGNQKGGRGGKDKSAQDNAAQPDGQNSGGGEKAQGGKEQPGKSGSQGGKSGKAGKNRPQPDGAQGTPDAAGAEKSDGQQGTPQQPMGQDNSQGKGPNDQKAPGEGGRPQGAARTDEGDPKSDKQGTGEPKEAGAGQNGDSGAGKNSQDKTGSGQGQETNRDRQKEMSDSGTAPENGETSAPSGSKRQSDSKGGTSGDRSGGGSKGAGQSGGQEGNDTAGSNSAADEGAGAANETGMGETGSRGGQGEKSDGKTGSAGDEKGDGSSSRSGENGSEKGGSSGGQPASGQQNQPMSQGESDPQSSEGDAAGNQSQNNQSAGARGKKPGSGTGPVVGGGVDADRPPAGYTSTGEYTEADKANLDFAKKATDLVLSKLKEQEHDPDPELLDRMEMTREQMQDFVRRWDRLKSEAERDPNAARELNDALRSLGLKDPKQRKRAGGNASDDQRGLRDSGTRVPPPSRYRDQFDAFRKGAARASNR